MRARHRHFKYSSAGAVLALDSRYVNVSDNTQLETWNDISGNSRNATQATLNKRPVFKTNIQGGAGVFRFDGTNRWYQGNFPSVSRYSCVAVLKTTGSNSNIYNNYTSIVCVGKIGDNTLNGLLNSFGYISTPVFFFTFVSYSNPDSSVSITRNDNFNIHSATGPIGIGTGKYLLNGQSEQTINLSTLSTSSKSLPLGYRLGTITWNEDYFLNGDVGLLSYYSTDISDSFRHRLEHAAAFSFKITCS